ncbi:MAG TPA: DNA translocase FtsK 4TM domain-containing protein, partial [Bryobacteraceae bacterium]|nr:DNA translocase FtsK 4TM domain-containing protein [Bryobacteraceae bacterium]
MKYLGPTRHPRLNEAVAVVFLFTGLFVLISLVSYHPFDPSLNTATGAVRAANLTGRTGAYLADFFLQGFGLAAYAIPAFTLILGWNWLRSNQIHSAWIKVCGAALLTGSSCAALGFAST